MTNRSKRARKAPASPRPRGPVLTAAALLALALGLYLNTLGHGFVFDDGALILQNVQVTDFRIGEMFGAAGYRPVRTLTYALNYAVGGASPFGFHLLNVLLHALCVVLLFRLIHSWGSSLAASAAGAAVFAAHPVQTAAVAYVSGRKDLLATAFLLGGLLLYTRFRRGGDRRLLGVSMALFALAVFSKEVAVVFPALLLLAEALAIKTGRERERPRSISKSLAFLARRPLIWISSLLVAGLGTYYILFVSKAARMTGYWGGGPAANYGTSLKLFAHYLKLAVWPHPLIADYKGEVFPLSPGWADPATLFCGLLAVSYLGLAFWAIRRRPLVAFGMSWFLVALLPVLQIIPFHEIAADHFLYLPLAGFAWLATEAIERLGGGRFRRAVWGGWAAIVLAFSALTVQRNGDWKDSRSLWEATLEAAPGSYRANANLGKLYYADPRLRERAVALTKRAVELEPRDPVALSNLGVMAYLDAQSDAAGGRTDSARERAQEAVRLLERALERNTRDGSVLSNLGNVHKLLGTLWEQAGNAERASSHRRQAADYFKAAVTRDRRAEVKAAWYNYALLNLEIKDYAAAADCLREFLRVQPEHARANLQMGWCQIQLDRIDQAVPYLKTAAAAKADPASARDANRLLSQIGR